jgi:hypothetical protein
MDVTSGPHAQFYSFCDALEVKDGVQAPENGWGGEHAVNAWGSYWRDFYFEQGKSFLQYKMVPILTAPILQFAGTREQSS